MRVSYIFIVVSLIISAIAASMVFFFTSFYSFKGFDKALEGILLFSSISLGFYGACLSVIASIFNTKVVKEIMKDKGEKKEFVTLVSLTLITGFSTVTLTIVYQVFMENGKLPGWSYDLVSAVWTGSVIMFVSMNVIFILVSFLIFFNNKEKEDKKEPVFEPQLTNSPFKDK